MTKLILALTALIICAGIPQLASAQSIPPDCMASFNVKSNKITIDINWMLATGKSAVLSCGAGEILREKLFIDGNGAIGDGDLNSSPDAAKKQASANLAELERKIDQLPGEDVPGAIFSAGGFLVSKYLLASCLLTMEASGGTCWAAAGSFIGATYKFFQKAQQSQNNSIRKAELSSAIQKIKNDLNSIRSGNADPAGARARLISTQTNLCRAIQRDCL